MHITLVFPPFYHPSMYNLPPLGLVNLATMLNGTSHVVTILDQVLAIRTGSLNTGQNIYLSAAYQILDTDPDLVSFSAQCVTYPPIIQIARFIKKNRPRLPIAIGGHNASFLAESTLKQFPEIDMIIRGEGEKTFTEMIEALETETELHQVSGLTWRNGDDIVCNLDRPLLSDLDSLPLPDYKLVPSLETYRNACGLPRNIAILEIGRGCPHNCIYCSEAALWQRRSRTYSVTRVIHEMQTLHASFDAGCFLLAYDQFTADRKYVENFCHAVLDAGLQTIPWYCISRLDTVDSDILSLMHEAGCESMCYGIDSGSNRTLSFIRKRVDQSILFTRVRETTEIGLVPTLSFVIGFPEEQKQDIDATLFLALQCGIQGNNNPLIQLPTVLPGTDLHQRYLKKLVRAVDTYFAVGLEFDHGHRLIEDETLISSNQEIFSSFWNLPCPAMSLAELASIASGFPLIINMFPKTFILLCKAFNRSASDLFLQFEQQIKLAEGELNELNANVCFHHFPGFAKDLITAFPDNEEWSHLDEILSYETIGLNVAAFAKNEKSANINLSCLQDWRPKRPKNVMFETFRFDMPTIVSHLKGGKYVSKYPEQICYLAFRQGSRELEVIEINAFGRDFLSHCSGETTLLEIASQLRSSYGKNMTENEFVTICQETAEALSQLELLTTNSHKPLSKEESHAENP